MILVGVAERLRRQVVALEIEGSNPSVHPTPSLLKYRPVEVPFLPPFLATLTPAAFALFPVAYLESQSLAT